MINTRVSQTGPIFEQGFERRIDKAVDQITQDVGSLLVEKIQSRLSQVLVNPTGHYRSKIQYSTLNGSTLVGDSGVVYGPWLEGTSSRNTSSRFKGYATFRQVTQQVETEVVSLSEAEVTKMVGDLS